MINKNRIKSKRKKNITNQSEKFRSLAPVTSEIKFNRYRNMFKTAFSKKYIANIAVTGPYSSGKSSIMQACKKKYGEDKFITLSLTNFNNNEIDLQKNIIIRENKEENLESQLINQLIHKIDNKKIKDSRFITNKKVDTKSWKYKLSIFDKAIAITLYIICGVLLSLDDSILQNFFLSKHIDIKMWCIDFIFFMSLFYIPYLSYKLVSQIKRNRIFKKIKFYGNEIELFTSDDTSIFDKHTDEILYLFENAGVKYFIFEDIDRYEDVTVFKKLREINILLNDKRIRENKPLIKFIYLICDNMFTAEERTKFFDFIIPVVPFIHKGNSYDYMIKQLFPEEAKKEKNKKFLIKISLFIDNARILKNIANEYYIYNKFIHLKDREPYTKFIKLLSLIIYKNLFPKDFNLLYFNKGYLAELFNKEAFAKEQGKSLEEYKNKTIKECINVNNRDIFFKAPHGYDYIYNSGYMNLIKFLITDGYIDETYNDYLSKITENSLTYEERAFLQNIIAHNGKQYYLPLSNILNKERLDNLLLFLDKEYFNQIEILNINLIYSILYNDYRMYFEENISTDKKNIYKNCIDLLMKKIQENKWYEFLLIYVEYYNYELSPLDMHQTIILNSIYDNYNDIGNILSQDDKFYIKFSYFTIQSIILFSDIFKNNVMIIWNSIKNNKDTIINYITTNKKFINLLDKYYSGEEYLFEEDDLTKISHNDIYNFINILYECNIKIEDISGINNIDLFNSILDKQLFTVNFNNVVCIIKFLFEEINTNNPNDIFQAITNINNQKLLTYIYKNFYDFLVSYPTTNRYAYISNMEVYNNILNNNLIPKDARELFKNRIILGSILNNRIR